MTSRILFVCLGNICRSPSAEGVFRAMAPGVHADSCGTAAWHLGKPPYGPMQAAAKMRGYDLSDLRARLIETGDFTAFDLMIAMDAQNVSDVEALRPAGNHAPVRGFAAFAPEAGMDHVPDPYYTRDFDAALRLIEEAARGLKRHLRAGGRHRAVPWALSERCQFSPRMTRSSSMTSWGNWLIKQQQTP